jgi:hypothetical protein
MHAPAQTSLASRLSWGALAALLLAGCGGGGSSGPPPVTCTATPQTVTASASWQLYGPADWGGACALTVTAPALATDERLALVLINAGGQDNASQSLLLTGTNAFADAGPAPLARQDPGTLLLAPAVDRKPLEEGHALSSAVRQAATAAWLAAGAPVASTSAALATAATAATPQVGDSWSVLYPAVTGPCVRNFSASPSTLSRKKATLRYITTHALFYVTDDLWILSDPANPASPPTPASPMGQVLAARSDLWTTLGNYFEGQTYPELHSSFGTETDVDGNGRLVFLLADLGRTSAGGFTVGYFDSTDVAYPIDTSPTCSGSGSNGADMLYLLDPCTFNKNGYSPPATTCADGGSYPYSVVIDQETPGTMAHELQHNVIFNTRCMAPRPQLASCSAIDDPTGDLWLNEGLSMISEDFAGFGLNGATERSRLRTYLGCNGGTQAPPKLCYEDVSLTHWPTSGPGDATGHYGGSHAFLRWHADQADAHRNPTAASGSAFTWQVTHSAQTYRQSLAAASGLTFEEGYARFATAALFSGEDPMFAAYPLKPAPAWSFAVQPAAWFPLHTTVGRVAYPTLPPAGGASLPTKLHQDGWGAYVSHLGTGADATLTISSTAAVQPRVVVVRFKGSLP